MAEKDKMGLDNALMEIHDIIRSPNSRYCLIGCKFLDQDITCYGGVFNKCKKGNHDKNIVMVNWKKGADFCKDYVSEKNGS